MGGGVAALIRPDSSSALSVRPYRAINEATVLSTAPEMFKDTREKGAFARLCSKVNLTRFGADCLAIVFLLLAVLIWLWKPIYSSMTSHH